MPKDAPCCTDNPRIAFLRGGGTPPGGLLNYKPDRNVLEFALGTIDLKAIRGLVKRILGGTKIVLPFVGKASSGHAFKRIQY